MQSRYYNPSWGRFINADGYASTGQGIIGNNSFAYCGNNPCRYADYSGQSPYGILDITDYYLIHKTVQFRCVWDTGLFMEVPVSDPNGRRGRLDLYNPIANTYYEVKSVGSAFSEDTINQMNRYDKSVVSGKMGEALNVTTPPTRSNVHVSGSFRYGLYDVTYELRQPGLIVYTPIKNNARTTAATAIAVAIVVTAIIATGGASAPAVIPALIPAFTK